MLAALLLAAAAAAPPSPPSAVSPVEVVAAAPLPGAELDRAKAPLDVDVLSAEDLARAGTPTLLRGLAQRAAGVSLSEAQANPFQPNLVYRGFSASPLGGSPQGLAVYVDGVRFNQAFGDTVNWDLLPDAAVESVTVEGSNPLFGLNALGGAVALRLKDGFGEPGAELMLSGGSFGRVEGSATYAERVGASALYVAAEGLHEDGWRAHSPSDLRRLYADLGRRGDRTEAHLKLIAADNDLTGNGPAPVELLAADRSAVFTYPDRTQNRFGLLSGSLRREFGEGWAARGQLYVSRLDQRTANADDADAQACGDDPDRVCAGDDGPPLTGRDGAPLLSTLAGPLGFARLNRTSTRTTGYGGALQLSGAPALFGRPSRLVVGASLDGGDTDFSATALLGGLATDRGFAGPGEEIDAPGALITPVRVAARNAYWGVYGTEQWDLTSRLTLTLSGRLNVAQVTLRDRQGTALDGDHSFSRFNPGVGATWRVSDRVNLYAGYAESNRAPTPAELSCADPAAPCSLTNFFVADPPLKQVVAHTVEAGVRGRLRPWAGLDARWKVATYRTETDDDLQLVASPALGRAYFRNVGSTRRQGLDARVDLTAGPVTAWAGYSHVEATFRTPLTLLSQDNPAADPAGEIAIRAGDRLPGIPQDRFTAGVDWRASARLTLSSTLTAAGGQALFGDEANLTPRTRGYAVVDLSGAFELTRQIQLFASVRNLFDHEYVTYGSFSPTSDVFLSEAPGASDPRSLTPAPPRAVYAGVRIRL